MTRPRALYLALVLLLAFPGVAGAQADGLVRLALTAHAPEPFFFVQMADAQFGMFTGDKGFARETELYEKAIAEVNRLRPAFVVNCGDLVNKPGDRKQIAELLRITRKLDRRIKMHWVAGNHDVGNVPTAATLKSYRKTFGPDRYVFRYRGTHGIVINSCICQRPEKVEKEWKKELAFLERSLKKATRAKARHKLVFCHHPLFLAQADEKDNYFNIPQVRRRRLLDLLKKHDVEAVFSGHYHRNAGGKDGRLEMVVTGPIGKPLGKDPSGFRIVRVYPDRIEHSYHGLDAMPEAVVLEPVEKPAQKNGEPSSR